MKVVRLSMRAVLDRLLALFIIPEHERLHNLLAADLRQQLVKYEAAHGRLVTELSSTLVKVEQLKHELECSRQRRVAEHEAMKPSVLLSERDQLRVRVAELEVELAKILEGGG